MKLYGKIELDGSISLVSHPLEGFKEVVESFPKEGKGEFLGYKDNGKYILKEYGNIQETFAAKSKSIEERLTDLELVVSELLTSTNTTSSKDKFNKKDKINKKDK